MRKLDSNTYNKMLADKLDDLQLIVKNNITSENIKFFPPELIKRVDDVLKDKYLWASGNINGFEVSKINQMISYLKLFKVETTVVTFDYPTDKDAQMSFPTPFGWDGRNSAILEVGWKSNTNTTLGIETRQIKWYESLQKRWFVKSKEAINLLLQANGGFEGFNYSITVFYWRLV